MFRVFWGQHHGALSPFVSLGLYFLWTEVFPIAFCDFQAPGVAEGFVVISGSGGPPEGDSPSILHSTSAAWFIFNPVYRSHLRFVLQLLVFSLWKRCVCFAPVREFPNCFLFSSNLYDLQLWRGFQPCDPTVALLKKIHFPVPPPQQEPWRSLYQKGLFLCPRYSLLLGEPWLPIFPSPGFGRALPVSREIPRLFYWNSVEARD